MTVQGEIKIKNNGLPFGLAVAEVYWPGRWFHGEYFCYTLLLLKQEGKFWKIYHLFTETGVITGQGLRFPRNGWTDEEDRKWLTFFPQSHMWQAKKWNNAH